MFDTNGYIENHCSYDLNESGRKQVSQIQLRNKKTMKLSDIRKYEKQKLSDRQIAKKYEISPMALSKIRKRECWDRKYKYNRSDKGCIGIRVPIELQKAKRNYYMSLYVMKRPTYDAKRVIRDGKSVIRQVHRIVAEEKLGRYLKREEVVHHADGNVKNNDIKNLWLFKNNADHLSYHRGEEVEYLELGLL